MRKVSLRKERLLTTGQKNMATYGNYVTLCNCGNTSNKSTKAGQVALTMTDEGPACFAAPRQGRVKHNLET